MQWHQFNISFPESLYQTLVRWVPAGERTRFLTRLTESGLRQLRLKKALDSTYGAWSGAAHPELKRGVRSFVRSLRKGRSTKA